MQESKREKKMEGKNSQQISEQQVYLDSQQQQKHT